MIKRWRRGERGAAAVEFALLLPFLLLIIGAIVDFGRFFYAQNITVNAAREGARMMALTYPSVSATNPNPPDAVTRIQQAMIAYQGDGYRVTYSFAGATPATGETIHTGATYTTTGTTPVQCPTGAAVTDQVTVTVKVTGFKFFLLGPAASLVGGGSLTPPQPNGTATMRCGG